MQDSGKRETKRSKQYKELKQTRNTKSGAVKSFCSSHLETRISHLLYLSRLKKLKKDVEFRWRVTKSFALRISPSRISHLILNQFLRRLTFSACGITRSFFIILARCTRSLVVSKIVTVYKRPSRSSVEIP